MDQPPNDAISQGIQAEPVLNVPASIGEISVGPRTQPYADWDDFRTNSPAVQKALADLATRALPDLRNAECLPLPPDLPSGTDDLGRPVASFVLPPGSESSFVVKIVLLCALPLILTANGLLGFFDIPGSQTLLQILVFSLMFLRNYFASLVWQFLETIACLLDFGWRAVLATE